MMPTTTLMARRIRHLGMACTLLLAAFIFHPPTYAEELPAQESTAPSELAPEIKIAVSTSPEETLATATSDSLSNMDKPLVKEGFEITHIAITPGTDIDKVISRAKEMVEQARRANPNIREIEIPVVLVDDIDDAEIENVKAVKIARLLQKNIDEVGVFVFEGVGKNKDDVRALRDALAPVPDLYKARSEEAVAQKNANLSIYRLFYGGVVSGIRIALDTSSTVAGLVGGVVAGFGTGAFQRYDAAYTDSMESRWMFDVLRDHRYDGRLHWRLLYGSIKTARHFAWISLFLGGIYLSSQGVFDLMYGTNEVLSLNAWATKVVEPAIFSASSYGLLKRMQNGWTEKAFATNAIMNYANEKEGMKRAITIRMYQHVTAFFLAFTSVTAEAAAIYEPTRWTGYTMMALAGIGGVSYLALREVGLVEKAREFWPTMRNWVRSKAQSCANAFGFNSFAKPK
jgi:hypothetical protein